MPDSDRQASRPAIEAATLSERAATPGVFHAEPLTIVEAALVRLAADAAVSAALVATIPLGGSTRWKRERRARHSGHDESCQRCCAHWCVSSWPASRATC